LSYVTPWQTREVQEGHRVALNVWISLVLLDQSIAEPVTKARKQQLLPTRLGSF
jgi:hypothetical protein